MTCVIEEAAGAGEWDAFVAEHPGSTADHLYAWRTIFEDVLGHRTAYLVARCDGRVAGVLPLVLVRSRVFGRSAIAVPFLNYGGLLADHGAAKDALLAEATARARAFGASHIELRHVERQCEQLPFRQHKLGMRREAHFRQALHQPSGAWWDEYFYALLAAEHRGAGA